MDSLMAVELRRRLEQGVGKELPATLAMDHPRLTDVADYLLSDILNLSEKAGAKAVTEVKSLAAADEPIAIVSVACRFPGSPDPDAFWQVLSQGVDAISEIPEDRFDVDEFYDPDAMTPARSTPARVATSTASTPSIRSSSASRRARPCGSTRSSG